MFAREGREKEEGFLAADWGFLEVVDAGEKL